MTPALSLVILIVLLAAFGTALVGSLRAAPWLPTRTKDVERLLSMAELREGEMLFDLGSGDGRLIAAAARKPGISAIGYEISLVPWIWSQLRLRGSRLSNARVRYQDFFRADFSQADVIVCFLTPWAMKKLKPKILREMKPGSRLVSYTFSLPEIKATRIDRPHSDDIPIFLYRR